RRTASPAGQAGRGRTIGIEISWLPSIQEGDTNVAVPTGFKQSCPTCQALLTIKDPHSVGKVISCPKCKCRFVVEAPAVAPAPPAPRQGGSLLSGLLIGCGVVVAALLLLCG